MDTVPLRGLTLAGFKARVGLAQDVNATAAANDLAIRVTGFQRLDGRYYFHFRIGLKRRKKGHSKMPVNGFIHILR